jgi:biotin carboxyl carrier protein
MTTYNSTSSPAPAKAAGGLSRKWTFGILILCFLFVLMPYLFWQATWFGKTLNDAEMREYLADSQHPRKAQHALAQIADRMGRGEASVRQWYPQVVQLGSHGVDEIRLTAAWVMGQDNRSAEFHAALAVLLRDPHPMVRRNAALALVRFGDAAGHDEIVAMLAPFPLPAPLGGTLAQRLRPGDVVNPGTLLARLQASREEKEVRCTVPGTLERWMVADRAAVQPGEAIALIAPEPTVVWEALRALVLIGRAEDLPAIERHTAVAPGVPEQLRTQAQQAMRAIAKRTKGM